MKITLKSLELRFRRSTETLEFGSVNFFWGRIGAGKSSIAKLIDYCLGADIQLTPALQLEFNSAILSIDVEGRGLMIYRERESSNVAARWQEGDSEIEVLVPARKADGIVVPGTEIEVLSDLIFHLAGISAPRVRKGRRTADERLERLSLRDLFRFCYVDQDNIDSDFFKLDDETDFARRAKSVDAMRFILGYHQDQVAQLESELQQMHEEKLAAKAAAEALTKVLQEAGFSDPAEIDSRIESLRSRTEQARVAAANARQNRSSDHAVDRLRERAKSLSSDALDLEEMVATVSQRAEDTERHLNELKMLSVRFSRTRTARDLLGGVDFAACPRCTQALPDREESLCRVCGQPDIETPHEHLSNEVVGTDLKARLGELEDTLEGLRKQRQLITHQLERVLRDKAATDHALNERLREYDSAFMSQALQYEREITSLEQEAASLVSYRKLPERLDELLSTADKLQGNETELRAKLNRERAKAFADRNNLRKLETFFLDCLVRSRFPGITGTYKVHIDAKSFVPEVMPTEAEDFAVTSFANMSSGGMKTIFKACYALALHRLAAGTGAALPSLLILDSAMKNVSERENRDLFQAFYGMVYELAATELSDTQLVLIDKEFHPVQQGITLDLRHRHMAPGSREHLPLIPYYQVPVDESQK
jgi:hypothetical protein